MAKKKEQNVAVPSAQDYGTWIKEIDAAEKALSKFRERARTTVKRYLDERDTITSTHRWFNIFYSNTTILESALYAQIPKPAVTRRFKDYQDDIARVAGIILQRAITQDLDDPRDTFDSMMRHCVQDRLVPGLAQAWVRLETEVEPAQVPSPEPGNEQYLRIKDKHICVDYIYWEDFIWSPCRVWEERRWVGRAVYMDRPALIKRFGEEIGKAVPLDYKPNRLGSGVGMGITPEDDVVQKAKVYEIWIGASRKVIWLCRGYQGVLDESDPPLNLVGFYPCPKPMLANVSTSNTVPRPDYYMIQDQYQELDTINQRITLLVKACKVVGVYDKSSPGVARLLKEGFDNDMIPVDNWAMFAEKNGIKGQTDWLPLEQVVKALQQLLLNRESIKQQIFELSGLADIVRGASKASETLGAQEIKAKFASVRINKLQSEVARFAAEVLRIKAEVLVRHFDPEEIIEMSNIMETDDAEFAEDAIGLLQSQEGFEWRIEVNADSIAQADYDMEKQDRVEFLTAVSGYLEKAGAMFTQVPQSAPLLIAMLKWAVAGFRKSNEIEGLIDKALDDVTRNPPEDKPDPEAQKAQAEMEKIKQQAEIEKQKAEQQLKVEERKAELEERKMQMELYFQQQKNQMEMMFEQQKMAMEAQQQKMEMAMDAMMQRMQMTLQAKQGEQDLELNRAQGAQQLQQSEQQHRQQLASSKEMSQVTVANKKAEAAAAPKPAAKQSKRK